jgi:hypothetical protein
MFLLSVFLVEPVVMRGMACSQTEHSWKTCVGRQTPLVQGIHASQMTEYLLAYYFIHSKCSVWLFELGRELTVSSVQCLALL